MPPKSITLPWLLEAIKSATRNQCILWPFNTVRGGYGQLYYEGKYELAHRVAFKIANGRWPTPCGLHTCDTPPCINPNHVFEGTRPDNDRDRVAKDRQAKGERDGNAKLTEQEVLEIRALYVRGSRTHGVVALARQYEVSAVMISLIVRRKNWKHI